MKDLSGIILYVGKAKNLRSRVSSYFNQSVKEYKTKFLVDKIHDFEFVLTESDADALILENNLIKKHTPRYNMRLKDDKSYPYIVVDLDEPFPSPQFMRRPKNRKGRIIFGPYPTGIKVYEILRLIRKSFTLRDCSLSEFFRRKNPCLLYQMKQCSAPCVGMKSVEEYQRDLNLALDFFKGKGKKSLQELRSRMERMAEKEEFEQAIFIRDAIVRLEIFMDFTIQKSVEFLDLKENVDVIGFYMGPKSVDLVIYIIREGLLIGNRSFHFSCSPYDRSSDKARTGGGEDIGPVEEIILTHLLEYYRSSQGQLPDIVILPLEDSYRMVFQEALDKIFHGEKSIQVSSQKRTYRRVLELAQKSAEEEQRMRKDREESIQLALEKIRELLSLSHIPTHIECFDVAIWQGKSPTAGQVVFKDGRLSKEDYRYYHLQERPEGNNDFAMMGEVLNRRLGNGNYPDLFVIDGGIHQVNVVQKVLRERDLNIPVMGLAKARVSGQEERLVIPGHDDYFILSQHPPLFRLLAKLRDEAHRFSRKLHHKKERKRVFESFLDSIDGIGQVTKQKILSRWSGTWDELKDIEEKELAKVLDISLKMASHLKRNLCGR